MLVVILCVAPSQRSVSVPGSSMTNHLEWCTLKYWEMQERVGPVVPIGSHHVNIFGHERYGLDGLSLESLGQNNARQPESSRKTRVKIGLGKNICTLHLINFRDG